jgi:hypothetical protein
MIPTTAISNSEGHLISAPLRGNYLGELVLRLKLLLKKKTRMQLKTFTP